MRVKRILFVLIGILFLVSVAAGHHHPEHFELHEYTDPEVALQDTSLFWQAVYWIWGFHDRWHWITILFMLYTCYHFRFFYGKNILKHPGKCSDAVDPGYGGERALMKWHRMFWRANIFLIAIHAWEWLEGVRTLITHGEFTYIWWPLDYETVVHQGIETYPVWQQGIGMAAEGFYIFAVLLWLGSCHFFRYLGAWEWVKGKPYCCGANGDDMNGCTCDQGTEGKDMPWILKMNQKHGIFMWMAVFGSVILLLVGGHL